ncbi:MAG TPA: Trk family potassium uptake protein, partial [Clostridiales bacterium]|nr:Trk family potassium uptake protein [Clostridiales bacterium]
ALVLFFVFLKDGFSPWRAFGYGVFHSVSAFCNAGFGLIGNKSLLPYVTNIPLNLTLMILTIWGGIGFSVWSNLAAWFRSRLSRRQKRKERLSLHSRLALVTTGILIVVGALLFLVFEWNNPNTLGPLSRGDRVLASFFQSVTLRTTGFSTVEQTALTSPSILLSIVWFMIGGSPGGTAGGMKTVTISILICTVWATLKGKSETHVFGRTIPSLALRKALTIVTLFVGLAFGMTALLAITERSYAPSFFQLIFEVCSALSTVGISQNLTPLLTIPGQIIIMVCMLIGRLGPISLVLALVTRHKKTEGLVRYSEEDVMIG